MQRPPDGGLEETLGILKGIANSFPTGGRESVAVAAAARALIFCHGEEVRKRFEHFLENMGRALTQAELDELKKRYDG
jgi:hypothetical protein